MESEEMELFITILRRREWAHIRLLVGVGATQIFLAVLVGPQNGFIAGASTGARAESCSIAYTARRA
jgi:hypothetical protein